jgi:Fe-S-cluster-containing dehydrogenase component
MNGSVSKISKYGLLINYEFCTGCHACEVACKKEHNLAKDQFGLKLGQYGPEPIDAERWDYTFVPMPTKLCDLCDERVKMGKLPTCVHHCPAKIIKYGSVEELAKIQAGHSRMVLFTPV